MNDIQKAIDEMMGKLENEYDPNETIKKPKEASKSKQIEEAVREAIITLEHAKTFISSKQKMHRDGLELHQNCINKLKDLVL